MAQASLRRAAQPPQPTITPSSSPHAQQLSTRPAALQPAALPRRALLASSLLGLLAAGRPAPAPAADEAPACATCLGVVDGTLGSCSGLEPAACASTYDDRPPYFATPWMFDGSPAAAQQRLVRVLTDMGAAIQQDTAGGLTAAAGYVRAQLPAPEGTRGGGPLDLEFVFAEGDNTVALRAAAAGSSGSDSSSSSSSSGSASASSSSGGGSQAPGPAGLFAAALGRVLGGGQQQPGEALEAIRLRLGWESVPILRNRQRTLLFGESPLDSFGPVPPPVPDYTRDLGELD